MAALAFTNIGRLIAGRSLKTFVYRDHGSLVSLSRYSTVGSLMGNLVGGRLAIEGRIARLVYAALYRDVLLRSSMAPFKGTGDGGRVAGSTALSGPGWKLHQVSAATATQLSKPLRNSCVCFLRSSDQSADKEADTDEKTEAPKS